MTEHKCGYYPPASKKALRLSLLQFGTPEFREARMKPCGKPATHVDTMNDEQHGKFRALYLCPLHAKHNARRGFRARRIVTTQAVHGAEE